MQASPKPHKSDRTPASGPRLDSSGLLIPIRFPVVRHAYVAAAPPELLSPLRTLDQVQAFAAERCIGASLPDTLGDPLGFFLFKLFLQCYTNAAAAIEFIEDVVAFKGTAAASARAVM